MRILYVEDDDDIRQIIAQSFERRHAAITLDTACDYEEAAAFLSTHTYDALISDFQYPGKEYRSSKSGGIDFYQLAVQTNPDVPFYFYSASDVLAGIASLPEYRLRPPVAIFSKPTPLLSALEPYLSLRPGVRETPPEFPQP